MLMAPPLPAISVARIMLRNDTGPSAAPLSFRDSNDLWVGRGDDERAKLDGDSVSVESRTRVFSPCTYSAEKNFIAFARCLASNTAHIPAPVSIAYPPPKRI